MVFLPILSLLAILQIIDGVLASDPPLNTTNLSSIEWGPCYSSVITNPALTCSFFELLLEYHAPSIGHGKLALVKLNVAGDRLGTPVYSRILTVLTSADSAIQVVLGYQGWIF